MGVRVLPPAPRGIVTLNIVAGLFTAGLFVVGAQILDASPTALLVVGPQILRDDSARVLAISVVLALYAAWACVMTITVPRMWTLAACLAANGITVGVVAIAYMFTKPVWWLGVGARELVVQSLGVCASQIALQLALGAVWRGAARVGLGRIVRQDGSMCWRCGYSRTGAASERCPECGEAWDLGRPRGLAGRLLGPLDALSRRAPVVATFLLVAFGAWIFVRLGVRVRNEEFVARMRSDGAHLFWSPDDTLLEKEEYPRVRWFAGNARMIVVAFNARARGTQPAMVMRTWTEPVDSPSRPTRRDIACLLDRQQARYVIEHGMPKSLLHALEIPALSPAHGSDNEAVRIDPRAHIPSADELD